MTTYHCSDAIVWTQDAQGCALVNRETGKTWILQDADALFWQMLAVGHRYKTVVQLVAHTLAMPETDTHAQLIQTLRQWESEGIVCQKKDNPNG